LKGVFDDLDFECAGTATYLTYRGSKTVIENLNKAEVSKQGYANTSRRWGLLLRRNVKKRKMGRVDLLYADRTKAHSIEERRTK